MAEQSDESLRLDELEDDVCGVNGLDKDMYDDDQGM